MGNYSPGGSVACSPCSAQNCQTCSSDGTLCVACPINFLFNSGQCNSCPMGQYSAGGVVT